MCLECKLQGEMLINVRVLRLEKHTVFHPVLCGGKKVARTERSTYKRFFCEVISYINLADAYSAEEQVQRQMEYAQTAGTMVNKLPSAPV